MIETLLAGRNILVVEDEMIVVMLIEDMLADLGCTSIAVANQVEQAIELIETGKFDAALLDLNLNGVKSYPVAAALAAKGIPFAFSTGYGDSGVEREYRQSPVLVKPFRFQDVNDVFVRILAA